MYIGDSFNLFPLLYTGDLIFASRHLPVDPPHLFLIVVVGAVD